MKASTKKTTRLFFIYLISILIAIATLFPIYWLFVVSARTKMNQIDSQTLKQIYTGAITNWKDLNGEDKPIVVISRDTNSGTFEVFNEHILKKDHLAPAVLMLASNRAILDEVGKA
jgi:phosphate transport system substrate-binding protein